LGYIIRVVENNTNREDQMKYDSAKHKFAVVQLGYALFGVGETEDEAIENAAEWIEPLGGLGGAGTFEDVVALLNESRGFHGDFKLIDDADEIAGYVKNI
jgi:hypothetical protein